MQVEDAIQKRRTVSSYKVDSFPEEWMNTAIKLALCSPNHKLTRPWRFFGLGLEARGKLYALLVNSKEKKEGKSISQAQIEMLKEKIFAPYRLLLIATKKSENPVTDQENYASTSCAIQNMMLFFTSKNIGTKWGTGTVIRDPLVYEMCGLDEKDWRIDALLYVGVSAHEPTPRKELHPEDYFLNLP